VTLGARSAHPSSANAHAMRSSGTAYAGALQPSIPTGIDSGVSSSTSSMQFRIGDLCRMIGVDVPPGGAPSNRAGASLPACFPEQLLCSGEGEWSFAAAGPAYPAPLTPSRGISRRL
jgi:hypothetical protein